MIDLLINSPAYFIGFTFIISLMIGSFLNVVIYRLPIMMKRSWEAEIEAYQHPEEAQSHGAGGESDTFNLVKPDSTCPKCGHKIRAWENIPVISWLALRAKCSSCKTPISARYPAIELLTAVLSALAAWQLGFSPITLAFILGTWMLVAMTFIDIDEMLLPDSLTLSLLWLGLLVTAIYNTAGLQDAVFGAIAGYMSLFTVYWAFKLLTGKEGMGFGDFKLLAAIGVWVGWQHLPIVILLSSVVGAIVGITLMFIQKKDAQLAIPFGPYLAAAGYLTVLYGDTIADWYLSTLG
ncbi:prepilin peptidase [Ningiella sp. W23]|uniref:prepilin peptidase n=1 Tax=Ningiella sp. W23 TaxID=3023715 RepID=UPI0037568213